MRCTGAALAACLSLGCASAPERPAVAPGAPVGAVFVDGIVLLEASLHGRQGLWLLDSGYEYSLLDSAAAVAASIPVSTPSTVAQPGGSVRQGWARNVSLDIGGRAFHADSVAAFSFSPLAPVVGKSLAGLLGHDFFEHFVVTIDYAARTVRLAEPAGWTPPAAATALTAWIESGETFVLGMLWADGRSVPAKLKLDTGSLSGLGLNGSFVAQNRLFPPDWPRRAVEGIAVGGATRNFVSRLDSMELGGLVFPQPVVGWSEDLERIGDAGTLGAPNLARFRVTFDYTRRRILLEPAAGATNREAWEGAGMLLVQVPDGEVVAAQVLPSTPAGEAGIEAGDVLRQVNFADAGSLGLDSLRRRFRHPGMVDTLVIEHHNVSRTVILQERDLP